ncbi:helix-turn-helix transcriptional regulator [Streptomyces sp. NPDC005811]|uniref:helix-turn-helix domain-containing protein n=1 Tax=Streptomyces sp. NPDC005811 TaxID=3154565 RepID=UPI0033FE4543
MNEGVDESGWNVEPGDEIEPVVQAVGRLLKLCRESAGMRPGEFGEFMGYGEDMIRKMERGHRIPRPEFLDRADTVLKARGHLRAFAEDMRKARYPKKVRELQALEGRAAEVLVYSNHNIQGLLQTPEYTRALFEMAQPPYSVDEIERGTSARVARKVIFERDPIPNLCFVQEQVTLERPLGGRAVLRRQLEHLLEVAQLRNVTLQVMPTDREEHAGVHHGMMHLLKFPDGTGIGRCPGAFNGRPVSDPRELRILEMRYGMIRAQALPPGETRAFIEQLLGRV